MPSLEKLNNLTREEFVSVVGPVFEKSPWIAEAVEARRPFARPQDLLESMIAVVEAAPTERLEALLCAHPDLAARLDEVARLTPESQEEQRAAGLLSLPATEAENMRALLAAYRTRFPFPFIICARLNDPSTILAALRERLSATVEEEKQAAWHEVQKIAELRLRDLLDWPKEDI